MLIALWVCLSKLVLLRDRADAKDIADVTITPFNSFTTGFHLPVDTLLGRSEDGKWTVCSVIGSDALKIWG